ncbi:DUF6731 family protein [Enterococcus lactis]|uniref:DUF6731 family protein n=1 Tax=Enterococcus lactis TaxID=357441 RepID=UPI0022DF8984|nr:DUF6731 family protein [Enterococcus lactis]
MTKMRNVRFEFYQINGKKCKDGEIEKGLYNIRPILEKITKIEKMPERDVILYGERVRLDKFELVNEFPNIYALHFTRLRNDKPAYIELEDELLKELPLNPGEYIAEDISCLYDEELRVLMIQRNIHSLSVSGVEAYLDEFKDDEDIEITLEFVSDKDIIEAALKNKKFRKIELRAASANESKKASVLNKVMQPFMGLLSSFGGTNFSIEISAGRTGEDLSDEEVKKTLEAIKEDKTLFSSALLSAKKDEGVPIEKFDLINGKQYIYRKYNVPEGSFLNSNSVIEDIVPFYYNSNGTGYRRKVIEALND